MSHFFRFLSAVILLKLFDYFLVIGIDKWRDGVFETESDGLANHIAISLVIASASFVVFVFRYFIYKYIFKDDTKQGLTGNFEYYTGPVKSVYSGYASSDATRSNAASGGIVSACMIELLNTGQVDGCLLYRLEKNDGKLVVSPFIASNEEEVLSCQGSIYIQFPALSPEVMVMLREFDGKLAVVGLPCAISAFRKKCEKEDSGLSDKISYMVGLFCGHTSQKKMLDIVLRQKNISECDISEFYFRKGSWRGKTVIQLKDSSEISFPSWHYNLYQNLYVHSHPGCLNCTDHFAENADISVGDIWIKEFKSKEIKHSAFTARTDKGVELLGSLIKDNKIVANPADTRFLFRANKRAVIFHKAARAKRIAGKFWGIKIRKNPHAKPAGLNEILAALIFLGMYRWSESKYGRAIFRLPYILLWIILIIAKLLTNF